jgi:hypothetical protein
MSQCSTCELFHDLPNISKQPLCTDSKHDDKYPDKKRPKLETHRCSLKLEALDAKGTPLGYPLKSPCPEYTPQIKKYEKDEVFEGQEKK